MTIDRLTFVYDADGSLVGEARYWFGTLFGAEHCSLCDITHTRWGRRADFRRCEAQLGLPIEYLHRDHVPADVVGAAGEWPAVVGHDEAGDAHLLLGRRALGELHGDVEAFERALRAAIVQMSS